MFSALWITSTQTCWVSSPQQAPVSHVNIQLGDSRVFMCSCLHTHQNFAAVTKPTAAVLSGQDERERLAVKAPQTHRMSCLRHFTHCWETCFYKRVISTNPFVKTSYKQEYEKLCVCVLKTIGNWSSLHVSSQNCGTVCYTIFRLLITTAGTLIISVGNKRWYSRYLRSASYWNVDIIKKKKKEWKELEVLHRI